MTTIDAITVAAAAVGAVLGIVNTLSAVYRDRVRLKVAAVWMSRLGSITGTTQRLSVTSEYAHALDQSQAGLFGVRVTNVGFVEVTIKSIGLTSSGTFARRFHRHLKLIPIVSDALQSSELPVRLTSRNSIVVWCGLKGPELDAAIADGTRVYASTACGLNVYGTSRLLRRLTARARANRRLPQKMAK